MIVLDNIRVTGMHSDRSGRKVQKYCSFNTTEKRCSYPNTGRVKGLLDASEKAFRLGPEGCLRLEMWAAEGKAERKRSQKENNV